MVTVVKESKKFLDKDEQKKVKRVMRRAIAKDPNIKTRVLAELVEEKTGIVLKYASACNWRKKVEEEGIDVAAEDAAPAETAAETPPLSDLPARERQRAGLGRRRGQRGAWPWHNRRGHCRTRQ